ncbi:phenylacetate--CoA ligase [Ravibacter arvi]|uniref:Phenylacetate--CoA ligase n=1 Tax=Ravibacter arvi TaxID=2051041 RepID=A0ABP8LUR6_9BACT
MSDLSQASREEIRNRQNFMLRELVGYVLERSVFYQRVFEKEGLKAGDVQSVEDLPRVPFTTKDDLARYNEDFLCVPRQRVADYVTTSGTLSDPVAFYLTDADIDRLAKNEADSFRLAGGSDADVYQLMTTIDRRFMAGLAYWMGARRLGAGMVRVGPGAPFLQWESIQRFGSTVLIAIPSFIPKLLEYAVQNGIDYKASSVKSILCIGEPIRNPDFSWNELGRRITRDWDVKLFSTYASTEMGAAFTECAAGKGGHLNPELLVLEVVDEDGNEVGDGELGEVVVTTLGVEGMPLLRYKTGDLCHIHYERCSGRNTPRLGPVVGRKQQMIKFKGTTLFPPAIYDVLDMLPEIELYQVEVRGNEFGNDEVTIFLSDAINNQVFVEKLLSLFRSRLRVTPALEFIPAAALRDRVFLAEKRKPEKLVYRTKVF